MPDYGVPCSIEFKFVLLKLLFSLNFNIIPAANPKKLPNVKIEKEPNASCPLLLINCLFI